MSSRRGSGKAAIVFAALAVLFTAGMMSHDNERHQYVWNSLWETAESEFSENDAPFAGIIVVAKDFGLYAAEAFAVLCAGLAIAYLAGAWGMGAILAGVLWFALWPPAHNVPEIALLFPLASGALTGFLVRREEPRSSESRVQWWKAVRKRA